MRILKEFKDYECVEFWEISKENYNKIKKKNLSYINYQGIKDSKIELSSDYFSDWNYLPVNDDLAYPVDLSSADMQRYPEDFFFVCISFSRHIPNRNRSPMNPNSWERENKNESKHDVKSLFFKCDRLNGVIECLKYIKNTYG